jgi:Trp operon repressor
MRKTIESAERFMTKYSEREKMERVLLIIQEILQTELPERRVEVMKRFAALGLKGATPASSLAV